MSFWEILHLTLFILIFGWVVYLFLRIVYLRYLYIRLGKPASFNWDLSSRLRSILIHVFGQKKLLTDRKSGWMHVIMFYGFIIIQMGALDLMMKGLFPGNHLPIPAYPVFLWVQEVTTALVLLAAIYAFYRRYVEKLPRLKRDFQASWVIILLTLLMSSILLTAAFEKVAWDESISWFTPISSLLAWPWIGQMEASIGQLLFHVFWWFHAFVLFTFLLYIPQSKHFHLLIAPINVFLKRDRPFSKLELIDFEDEEAMEFGRGKIEDFRQDQLIDLYACVECGRCTDVCPASNTGKLLSPMDLIVKMRDHLTEKGAALTSTSPWMPSTIFQGSSSTVKQPLIGGVITQQELWACTTCRSCEEACPVMNEHVDKIIDMRRYLVMTEGSMNTEVSRVFQHIERQGNPWGINKKDRLNWTTDLESPVPTVSKEKDFEFLFYVGSMGSFDRRSQKIAQAFVKILQRANVKFAVLGQKEKNSGDTARRLGNEFLFQQLATEMITEFKRYSVKKIVTIDPHAFHTFKNEYPDLGFEVEVYHHTQVIAQLLREKRIIPTKKIEERVTYHDSCYLGRYNREFDAPRYILKQIPGVEFVEMNPNREKGMCCGAGGGLMWMEETEGTRINIARTEQALEVQPNLVSSACPYCLTMLSDGVKAKEQEEQIQTMDVAEILALSME